MSGARARDREDLANARHKNSTGRKPSMWRCFGPGLITGAADDDPSGIGTYSVAGAQFGYGLLWLTPVCIPLMIAVQEMCGRVGRVCGTGLAAIIKLHYPRALLYVVVALLTIANIFNIYADLNIMAACMKMLFGASAAIWLTLLAGAIVTAQIVIPYSRYVTLLKWFSLALLSYLVTAFLPSVHNDWQAIAYHFVVPNWQWNSVYLMTVVGYLGTTITPYLFFWQASEEVEEQIAEGKADGHGKRTAKVNDAEIRGMRIDTAVGMTISQLITFFIITCTAATLHARGITDINSAEDAAKALLPLGHFAYYLFTIGILCTGLIAIPTLAGSSAYALAETFGWRLGLYRRFERAKQFYGAIAIMVTLGYLLNFVQILSPIKALLYSAVLNGIVTFPLLIMLMVICNNRIILGRYTNGKLSNIMGIITIALMGFCIGLMAWDMMGGNAHAR